MGDYPGARGNEVQIETEDIRNNENYNIYCTDELSARKFLTPKMLEWFDRQISQNAMCVFLKDKKLLFLCIPIAISFRLLKNRKILINYLW